MSEPTGKIDIKTELYCAVVPYAVRLAKVAWGRYRELPKLDVWKNFFLLYLIVGYIQAGVAGALPAMALSLLGISPAVVNVGFFLAWPAILWAIGSQEHVILSLGALFIAAVYISHFKERSASSAVALEGARAQLAQLAAPPCGIIDVTPMAALAAPGKREAVARR
jgi:hypothetical protein